MSAGVGSGDRQAGGDALLILLLAGVTAIGPFTLHALSPALPVIAEHFAVSAGQAQLMLSLSLVAMAAMTLVWGPLSDRYGRRPIMLIGLVIAAAGSAMAAMADVLWVAVVGRLLQAGGGAAGMVLARAVAQDVFGSERSGDVIGKITAVMVAAPMIAPTVSGLLVEQTGWAGVFWVSAAMAAGLAIWTSRSLGETSPSSGKGQGPSDLIRGFAIVGGRIAFWRYAGYAACSLSAFYFFVGITPHVMVKSFDAGPAIYGTYFMLLSGTFMATNFVAGPISRRFGTERALLGGAILSVISQVIVIALLLAGYVEPIALFLPGMLNSLGAGLAVPNAMAGAISSTPERAGAASGFVGFCQFLLAAITTQIGGLLPHTMPIVVPVGMLVLLVLGVASLVLLRRPE